MQTEVPGNVKDLVFVGVNSWPIFLLCTLLACLLLGCVYVAIFAEVLWQRSTGALHIFACIGANLVVDGAS